MGSDVEVLLTAVMMYQNLLKHNPFSVAARPLRGSFFFPNLEPDVQPTLKIQARAPLIVSAGDGWTRDNR